MSEPLLPLYEAYQASLAELKQAQEKHDVAKAALLTAMPEGIEFVTVLDHPPILKRQGDQILEVAKPFLGNPYPAPEVA